MKTYRYVVSGAGSFPIDMLRYDSAWPASELDAGLIEESFRRGAQLRHVRIESHRPPTEDRWQSFLWNVKQREVTS